MKEYTNFEIYELGQDSLSRSYQKLIPLYESVEFAIASTIAEISEPDHKILDFSGDLGLNLLFRQVQGQGAYTVLSPAKGYEENSLDLLDLPGQNSRQSWWLDPSDKFDVVVDRFQWQQAHTDRQAQVQDIRKHMTENALLIRLERVGPSESIETHWDIRDLQERKFRDGQDHPVGIGLSPEANFAALQPGPGESFGASYGSRIFRNLWCFVASDDKDKAFQAAQRIKELTLEHLDNAETPSTEKFIKIYGRNLPNLL